MTPQDPWCDPDHPILLKFEDISAAAYRIKDGIINTPCDRSHMNSDLGLEMYFKKDYMQVVKLRDTVGPGSGGPQRIPGRADNCILCSLPAASRREERDTL